MLVQEGKADQFFARPMRASDLDHVVQMEAVLNEHPWSKRVFSDCLRAGYECWVLANKQQVIAYGVMSVAIGESHLLALGVHADYQRRGYARRLFQLLLDRAAKLDATQCYLEVRASNFAAISLYRSMGFVQISTRKNYYPASAGREDALIMCRGLAADLEGPAWPEQA